MFKFENLTRKLLDRSFDYVYKVSDFSIDGCVASAILHGTEDYDG